MKLAKTTIATFGRRFLGVELKDEYHAVAVRNCERALKQSAVLENSLF